MRPFRLVLRRRVVVNLLSNKAIEGVLVARNGPLLVVKDARLLEPGSDPVPVDGEIVIERAQVDFIQAL